MTDINPSSITPNFQWMAQRMHRILAFGFGSGLSPIAPGTAGTLWAWAAFLIAQNSIETTVLLWTIGFGILLGCWVCGHVSEELGKNDYGGIVWDEMMAFWLVLIVIMPASIWTQIWAFALFRFFDAVKPGPIGMIDRHFKNQKYDNPQRGFMQTLWLGFGIMIDDIAAAIFTLLGVALTQALIAYIA